MTNLSGFIAGACGVLAIVLGGIRVYQQKGQALVAWGVIAAGVGVLTIVLSLVD